MSAVRSLIPTCEPPLICLEMASSEKYGSAAPEPQWNIPKTVSHWCPSLFSISVRRTLTKSNSWRKEFIDLQFVSLGHSPLRETKLELEAGTWRQGLKQRLWEDPGLVSTADNSESAAQGNSAPPASVISQENGP